MKADVPKRSRRRMDRARMKGRAVRVLDLMKFPASKAGYWADNLAKCSCAMCCNNRRFEGPTRQELAFIATGEEQ